MSIDDPIKAAEEVLASEDRSRSLIRRYAADIASWMPGYVGKAFAKVREDASDKLAYMVDVLKQELTRVRAQVEQLIEESAEHGRFYERDWLPLVLDGLKRAEQTRTRGRIDRIARILANSLMQRPAPDADDVEEMMRIATDLSDRDVVALRLIVESLATHQWTDRLSLKQAYEMWKQISWRANRFSDSDVESICSKLASFGLLARLDLPPNQNMLTTEHNAYELMQKGRQFARFITDHGSASL